MARDENVSGEHFDWLVDARTRNQKSAVMLYKIIERHAAFLEYDLFIQSLAQNLTAVAFSLWRAVFLSDLTGQLGHQLADLRRFLRSLIAHNTVLYQTDFTSREWAFRYYHQNARYRLHDIASKMPHILQAEPSEQVQDPAKGEWLEAQTALDAAIARFEEAMVEHGPK